MKLKAQQRATSLYNFLNQKIETLQLEGEWNLAFGNPEKGGIWYISGLPGSGKTSFVVQLIKMFSEMGQRVRFYNFEEQYSAALQEAFIREGFDANTGNVRLVNTPIPYAELKKELTNTRTNVAVIDSRKKAKLKANQIEELRELFPGIIIAIICHVKGNGAPEQAADAAVFQEASLKIKVDRFRAISLGRSFGERGYYNVWKERADKCWAENL